MKKEEKILFVLGLWVSLLSFFGFPRTFKAILFVLTGLGIMWLAYIFYQRAKKLEPKNENQMHSFIDNIPNEK